MAKEKKGDAAKRPITQQRGKGIGPDLSKVKPVSKEKLEELLDEWADDIQSTPEGE